MSRYEIKNANVVIPIYSSESLSTVYFRKDPTRTKEVVQKNYSKGLGIADDDFVAQLTASGYNTINFYQNWVGLFRKEFMSPWPKEALGFTRIFAGYHSGRFAPLLSDRFRSQKSA